LDGFTKRTKEKMKKIEETTISLLHLELNDMKIADIAKKANVSQVTIYNYYGSKEKLVQAAIKRLTEQQVQLFEEIISGDLSFEEKLKQIIFYKKQAASQVNLNVYMQLMAQDKEFQQFIAEVSAQRTIPLFLTFIQTGRQTGHIRDSVKDETLLFYLNIMTQAFSHLDKNTVFPKGYEEMAEGILDMFLYGILNQK
jgi:AcrR family transcriptional regulator